MFNHAAAPNPNNIPAESRIYITSVPKLVKSFCGHKVDVNSYPNVNCEHCWTFFFISNQEFTTALGNDLANGHETALIHAHGKKVVKKAKEFFHKVAELKTASDSINKQLDAEEEYDVVLSPDAELEAAVAAA